MERAYAGLDDPTLAKMVIALRVPDYGDQMAQMLKSLENTYRKNPHYLGWAWHCYNDMAK